MKKYTLLIALALLTSVLLCAASCDKNDGMYPTSEPTAGGSLLLFPETSYSFGIGTDESAEPVTGTKFTYEKEGANGSFSIMLFSNGTFSYHESSISSHVGVGEWTLKDGILTLTELDHGNGSRINRFSYSDDALTFIAEGSDKFNGTYVADGEKFNFAESFEIKGPSSVMQTVRVKIFKFKDVDKNPDFGLIIFETGTFSILGEIEDGFDTAPGISASVIFGSWTEEDGIITLSAFSADFNPSTYRFGYDDGSLVYMDDDADFFGKCTFKKGDVLVEA